MTIRERAKLVVKHILLANKEVTTGDLFKQAVEDIQQQISDSYKKPDPPTNLEEESETDEQCEDKEQNQPDVVVKSANLMGIESELLDVIETHVRQVGDLQVYLEAVRPKWRRHDIIEIGSDLH